MTQLFKLQEVGFQYRDPCDAHQPQASCFMNLWTSAQTPLMTWKRILP